MAIEGEWRVQNYARRDSNKLTKTLEKPQNARGALQNPVQFSSDPPETADADVTRVVQTWLDLPEAIRRAVLALVDSAARDKP
jgi:hypothetical protein